MQLDEYTALVREITKTHVHLLPVIENKVGVWQVDHIVPITPAYKLGIPPELVGSLENLQRLTQAANLAKGNKFNTTSEALLTKWGFDVVESLKKLFSDPPTTDASTDTGRIVIPCLLQMNFSYSEAYKLVFNTKTKAAKALVSLIEDLHNRGISVIIS